jgi:DNA polymerase-1
MLLAYALEAGRRDVSLIGLGDRWLEHRPGDVKSLLGTGRNAITFDRVSIEAAGAYAADAADIAFRLALVLKPRLADTRVTTVYELLERPMMAVLAAMEKEGITVDRQILSRLSGDFSQTMARLEDEIGTLAGEPFNLGSPKQLGEILFEKKGLPGGRRTKTGAWSTDADILEELAADGHELPARILDWRQVSKLKSTYTDALPDFINPETGRVHTSYALAATPTARLSSSDPNLQNIPVRTEMGRKIRTAFVAAEGNRLISADYSQIELRVLAHMAEIPQLRQAFADGLDIHAMTASEMFGVPVEGMPADVRRRAKAINFGIVYGISAFGLANQLSIPRAEAKDYIDRYFQRFPGIRDYMESTKAFCRANGFVTTIFGRKCHYPLILSRNPSERAFNERAAVNATIQGSAADIIRRAMIRMPGALRGAGLSVRMLLQVHDELVFEANEEEVAAALPLIKAVMERAPEPAAKLRVPLQVDARAGDNWEAAH